MRDVDVPDWLKDLPLAPEFRPTDTEFADPIAYISKIEKEASSFGICKIIPPLPKPSKKYVFSNLNKSLLKCPELGDDVWSSSRPGNDGVGRAVFTTRHQELGYSSGKRMKGAGAAQPPLAAAHKQVWQSGEVYTLEQFESKSKTFARSQLGMIKDVSPSVIETLFWKAACEKPIYIEYANDVPGSAFGEPEGPFRYLHRRRRRRKRGMFDRNNHGCAASEKEQVDKRANLDENNGEPTFITPNSALETCKKDSSSLNAPNGLPRETGPNAGNEMEGTSGWRLSNSPWNLQVIARSPGSLTRFMPDDIPGVTSPMVYIGMLFSWFAWHVEDHELHSLNFLHIGSPKTWYSVPGDYALTFEEVIRAKAYGGAMDRLAALKLLGEKTTLLSPEAIIEAGIPCCRLVQNPGEFVVTFPRAYHIGFSHGFNCGEAANFGTPKWLTVAREAAVRRAAMNFLPMLSHQQLLYLLTMSFISRVPRSLLPGVRSSRLRDRQKEERELLVKKAFIEDLLNENILLATLLQRNSCYHTVLWDLELLPSSVRESGKSRDIDAVLTTPFKDFHLVNDQSQDLSSQMSLYIQAVDDPFLNDDDLSNDFQVESGTLPCVACGVLGFPFMSVIQPSEKSLMDFMPTKQYIAQDHGNQNPAKVDRISEDQYLAPFHPGNACNSSEVNIDKSWNFSNPSLRPRIFCLEHACKIEELLRSKGGAKILIICHSDFQKIKAQAGAIAEQIGTPFRYNEIQLDTASPDDLHLINLAIDDEQQDEDVQEDWTSKLNMNLRQCVKLRNKASSEKLQHALILDALFADSNLNSGSLIRQWQSRKSRSKRNLNHPVQSKQAESCVQMDVVLEEKQGACMERKEKKIIQYSRRTVKPKIHSSLANLGASETKESSPLELDALASTVKSFVLKENQSSVTNMDLDANSARSLADLSFSIVSVVDNAKGQTENPILKGMIGKDRGCDLVENDIQTQNEIKNASETSAGSPHVATHSIERTKTQENPITEEISTAVETSDVVAESNPGEPCNVQANTDVLMQDYSEPLISMDSGGDNPVMGCFDKQIGKRSPPHESQVTDSANESNHVSNTNTSMDECNLSVKDSAEAEVPSAGCDANQMLSDGEEDCSSRDKRESDTTVSKVKEKSISRNGGKRKREVELLKNEQCSVDGFIRSPCEGLRPRGRKDSNDSSRRGTDKTTEEEQPAKEVKKASDSKIPKRIKRENRKEGSHKCDKEGCKLTFQTKAELLLHKRNKCPHEGCGKKFSSHKYAVLHVRVHEDDRPLKCSWKGCKMTFKWAWARTEHLRVHTGERPYKCKVEGCGLTFRFVSDFSRHRRKTGHYVNVPA